MKKAYLAGLLCLMTVNVAFAETTFNIGPEVSHILYEEESVDVEEEGIMAGVSSELEFRPDFQEDYFINSYMLDARVLGGVLDYSGSGTIDNINNYLIESRFRVGHDFTFDVESRFTPFIGVGYRWLFDDGGGSISSTGAAGYDRQSQYLYMPIGAEVVFSMMNWDIGLSGEYDILLHGWQHSYLSDVDPLLPNVRNNQDSGYGYRASIDIVKKGLHYNFLFSPYIKYWHIDDSDVTVAQGSGAIVTAYEPENTSTEIGGKIGVQF